MKRTTKAFAWWLAGFGLGTIALAWAITGHDVLVVTITAVLIAGLVAPIYVYTFRHVQRDQDCARRRRSRD